jgi:hypothetical protein
MRKSKWTLEAHDVDADDESEKNENETEIELDGVYCGHDHVRRSVDVQDDGLQEEGHGGVKWCAKDETTVGDRVVFVVVAAVVLDEKRRENLEI